MNKKEKYDMKPIVTVMDSALKKLMNKENFINQHQPNNLLYQRKRFVRDLDTIIQQIKDECTKKLIGKIFIGVDSKYTVGWRSYLKIGNQTFYMTTCETKEEAEWFAEQLKCAIMSIAQE